MITQWSGHTCPDWTTGGLTGALPNLLYGIKAPPAAVRPRPAGRHLVCPPGPTPLAARGLAAVLVRPARRARMVATGAAARRRCRPSYSW